MIDRVNVFLLVLLLLPCYCTLWECIECCLPTDCIYTGILTAWSAVSRPHLCSVSADRTDVCDGLPAAAAIGVFLHAAGVALRFHRLPGTLPVCPGAADMVEEVWGCSKMFYFFFPRNRNQPFVFVCPCVHVRACVASGLSTCVYEWSWEPCGSVEVSTGSKWKGNGQHPLKLPSSPWRRTQPTLTPSRSPWRCAQ